MRVLVCFSDGHMVVYVDRIEANFRDKVPSLRVLPMAGHLLNSAHFSRKGMENITTRPFSKPFQKIQARVGRDLFKRFTTHHHSKLRSFIGIP